MPDRTAQGAADLYWLVALLTGRRETAAEVTVEAKTSADDPEAFFSTWMLEWSRKMVVARALAAVRRDFAASARRTALRRAEKSALPPPSWSLDPATTKSDLEGALLPIDLFPRAVVLLLIFERMPFNDVATLLNAEPDLIRTGLAAGLRDLTLNLAMMQGWNSIPTRATRGNSEWRHV